MTKIVIIVGVIIVGVTGYALGKGTSWVRYETERDFGLLYPGNPPPVPPVAGSGVPELPKKDGAEANTILSRVHDDELLVTCWFVWQPRGSGVALSCIPDSAIRRLKALAENP